jgi:hypothetical protein
MYRLLRLLLRGNVPTALAAGSVLTTDTNTARNGSCNAYFEVCLTGTTSQRPQHGDPDYSVGVPPGLWFYDTTISAFAIFDGMTWRNPLTGSAV